MRAIAAILVGGAASLSLMDTASAASLSAATILQDFNAVIYGNASTPSDVEGAAVIGGSFAGATVYNNPNGVKQPSGFGALTVYGSTSGNNININNGGSAYVGGNQGARINFNGGGSYIAAPGYTMTDFQSPLNALSQSLSQLAANSIVPPTGNNEVFSATPGSNGVAVFSLTAAMLASIPSFKVALNGASTVVFNVNGSSANFSANDQSGATGANNIIWNFYNATGSVNIGTLLGGSVLAPFATVSNGNQIDGTLVASAWTGQGELHNYGFIGTLPDPNPNPTPVPEPASLVLLGMGLVGAGLVRRRQPTQ